MVQLSIAVGSIGLSFIAFSPRNDTLIGLLIGLNLAGFALTIFLLALCCRKSQPGTNRFGPHPTA